MKGLHGTIATGGGGNGYSEQQVEAQLSRILASEQFARTLRLCELLSYLVKHSLNDDTKELGEYSVGLAVFGRESEFDPHMDNIVRVSAGRLRERLAQYYAQPGRHDELVFCIPNGHYKVHFLHPEAELPALHRLIHAPSSYPRASFSAIVLLLIAVLCLLPYAGQEQGSGEQFASANEPTVGNQIGASDNITIGQHLLARHAPGDPQLALSKFETAVTEQPENSDAWIGLAKSSLQLWELGQLRFEASWSAQYSALSTALRLQPDNPGANAATANLYLMRLDYPASAQFLDRALQSAENHPEVLAFAAAFKRLQGNLGDAVNKQQRAVELDPLSAELRLQLGRYLLEQNQVADAITALRNAQLLSPLLLAELDAYIALGLLLLGDINGAQTQLQKGKQTTLTHFTRALLYYQQQNSAMTAQQLSRLASGNSIHQRSLSALALANTGDIDAAYQALTALVEGSSSAEALYGLQLEATNLYYSPFNSPLTGDPRWQKLRAQLGEKGVMLPAHTGQSE